MELEQLIGNTPLVTLNRINPKPESVRILGKLEAKNPGGSIKDRAALSMVLMIMILISMGIMNRFGDANEERGLLK